MNRCTLRCVARRCVFAILAAGGPTVLAQNPSGSLRGVIADASGAVVTGATVELVGPGDQRRQATSDQQGRYQFDSLPPAEYRIEASAPGFAFYTAAVNLAAGRPVTHRISLVLSSVKSEVTVADQGEVTVDPTANASAVVLQGETLKTLSDDRDRLEEDLQSLAGPAVGPSGGEIFVDGFSGGRLPSKASIREIRVNQNPFSAEYDRVGFGRVEVFTKPGTDRLRGEAGFEFGDARLNARNPFATERPPSQRRMLQGNLAGPLGKRSSFFLALERFDNQETSVINAMVLNPAHSEVPFRQAVVSPGVTNEIETRLDRQLTPSHTLVGRFLLEKRTMKNTGLDTFTLPERAITREMRETGGLTFAVGPSFIPNSTGSRR
jgi:hypothetical protein